MGFSTETSTGQEMAEGGNFLTEPGTYHATVISAESPPTKKDGTLIDGGVVRVELAVLAGGPQDKSGAYLGKGKSVDLTFFSPNLSHKDGGKMGRKKLTALLIAMGEVTEATAGGNVDADEKTWQGRQVVVTLAGREQDGKKYIDLNFDDIYHVDHPDVATAAKDEKAIAAIPPSGRRPNYVAELEAVKGGSNGNGSQGTPANGNGQQQATPPADDDDLGL